MQNLETLKTPNFWKEVVIKVAINVNEVYRWFGVPWRSHRSLLGRSLYAYFTPLKVTEEGSDHVRGASGVGGTPTPLAIHDSQLTPSQVGGSHSTGNKDKAMIRLG